MLNLKAELAKDVKQGIEAAQAAEKLPAAELPDIVIDRSENAEHGDYASPIALALTKQMGVPPLAIVEALAEHMPKKEYIGRLVAAPPGFLNIWLNPGWMTAKLDNIIEGDICADIKVGEGKSANLEFISANPTGPLTLGNIRTAFTADTLANVLECAGYDVTREYYFNDAGAQVRKLGESIMRRVLKERGEKIEFPEDLYQGGYIIEVGRIVAEKLKENEGKVWAVSDLEDKEQIARAGNEAAGILMSQIKQSIKDDLKIRFDVWTSEAELRAGNQITEALQSLEDKKLVYAKDGAKYLKTTDFGDTEDRVVVKSDGEPAYIAPDIAYHLDKYKRGFEEIFTFVGADHQGHLPKLMAAMKALDQDTDRLHLIAAQWLRVVKDGQPVKLSKRAGQVVTPADLIAEVGYDAARFNMVLHALTTHLDFDLDLAKEKSERNPVYYVQYAYVRLQSILRQAKEKGVLKEIGEKMKLSDNPSVTHTHELALMRQLYRLPEVVAGVAKDYEIHDLAYYAKDLAKSIHVFYRHVPVLAAEGEELINSRLQLVLAAKTVLGRTLDLLGVSKPDVM